MTGQRHAIRFGSLDNDLKDAVKEKFGEAASVPVVDEAVPRN
tara:strand:- start:306 stop:431 length:126 start_codon:yes stop_codon:yes gene_type:complete